jgi:tetratricopeptide (TPR) repeat protein
MSWGRCGVALFVCAAALLAFPRNSAAQSKDEAASRALFDEAVHLRDSGQVAAACPKLEQARKLFTSPGLIFNLADCYERLGRTSEAHATFDEAARIASESGRGDLAGEAARRRDSLKPSDSPPGLAAIAAPAVGPSAEELAARALFDEGRALRDAGRYDDACHKFEASSKRFASAGVVFNLADCYMKLGRTASAWTALRDAAAIAGRTNHLDLASQAADAAKELEPKLMRLAIHVAQPPAGLILKRDGSDLAPATWNAPIPVDAGAHEIQAEAPGYEPWSASVHVSAPGETVSIDVPELRPLRRIAMEAPIPVPTEKHARGPVAHPTRRHEEAPTERGWVDADVGGAYADVTLFNSSTLALERRGRAGPTFSFGLGLRLDALTLGARVRDLALPGYDVWEVDGEGALHTRFDRFDGHVGFRGGYAVLSDVSGVGGLNLGAFFGFDYYASHLVSIGLDVCPEILWLQGSSQASLGFGFEATGRFGLHF